MRLSRFVPAVFATLSIAACDKSPTGVLDPRASADCVHNTQAALHNTPAVLNACWRQAIVLPFTSVIDINENGQVLGITRAPTGEATAGVWTAGVVVPLQGTGTPLDLNNKGESVGVDIMDVLEAVLWDAAGVRHHLFYGGFAKGINDSDVIVGAQGGQAIVVLADSTHISPVTGAAASSANAINNAGTIAGTYSDDEANPDKFAFTWTQAGGFQQLMIPEGSVPTLILDDGTIYGNTAAGNPFRYTVATGYVELTPANTPGVDSFPSTPRIASQFGEVLGFVHVGAVTQAVTWSATGGVSELRVVGSNVESEPVAINSASDVIGNFTDAAGVEHTVLWTWNPTKYGVPVQTIGGS